MKNIEDNFEEKPKKKLPISTKFFFSITEGFFSMIPFKEKLGLSDAYDFIKKINYSYNSSVGRLAGQLVMTSVYAGLYINLIKLLRS